jgi:diamine N-acetyltransferase
MIYGDRVRLRAIEREDIPTFLRWFNDPEVRHGLLMFAPMGRAEEERWFEGRLNHADDYLFAVEARLDDGSWLHIGNVGLHRIDWKSRNCIFGIALGEKAQWGHGYGTDATRTMLRFGFAELNLHRIELEVFDFNRRAMRVYEKAGFRLEGTRRQTFYQDGQYHDAHVMAVLRDEFLKPTGPIEG